MKEGKVAEEVTDLALSPRVRPIDDLQHSMLNNESRLQTLAREYDLVLCYDE